MFPNLKDPHRGVITEGKVFKGAFLDIFRDKGLWIAFFGKEISEGGHLLFTEFLGGGGLHHVGWEVLVEIVIGEQDAGDALIFWSPVEAFEEIGEKDVVPEFAAD